MQNVHFTPPELARRLGVNESTIKRWIDRGILKADRTNGGHRRVSEVHLRDFIQQNPKIGKKSYHIQRWKTCTTCDWREYFDLHHKGEQGEAREYLHTRLIALGDMPRLLEDVVLPALREIGTAWRKEELDIADEHRMSFYIRADLLSLQALLPEPKRDAPLVLLACTPRENHELPLVLLAAVAKAHGWRSVVLGINVPLEQVDRSARSLAARAIVLTKVYRQQSSLSEDIVSFARRLPPTVHLLIGGPGWTEEERTTLSAIRRIAQPKTFQEFARLLTLHSTSSVRSVSHGVS